MNANESIAHQNIYFLNKHSVHLRSSEEQTTSKSASFSTKKTANPNKNLNIVFNFSFWVTIKFVFCTFIPTNE